MIRTKALAYDIAVDNADGVTIYYNYVNNGKDLEVTTCGNDGYSSVVVIPENVIYMNRTRKVISIRNSAFEGCNALTGVRIPDSVTSIGNDAFKGCSSLVSVIIPGNVTSIGDRAFWNCCGLTSIRIPSGVTSIGDSAFYGCSALSSVTFGKRVTSIGNQSFCGCCSLATIKIPVSVRSIGYEAFAGCSDLTSVIIPAGVRCIGNRAFYGCDIPEVICNIEHPFNIFGKSFTDNTFYNATLYVPEGTLYKYKSRKGWKDFVYIEEMMPEIPASSLMSDNNGGFGGNGGYGVTTASVFSNAIQSGCVAILRLGQRSFRAIARLLKKDNPVLSKSPNIAIEGM